MSSSALFGKSVVMAVLLMWSAGAFAQWSSLTKHAIMVPNYKNIAKAVSDPTGDFYYPMLMDRFVKGDSTLTFEQCHYLYYGSVFQKNYDPYQDSDNSVRVLMNEISGCTGSPAEVRALNQKALVMAREWAEKSPFSVDALVACLTLASRLENDTVLARYQYRVMQVLAPIMRSGDGKTMKKAMHVLYVSNEYSILQLYQLFPREQKLIHKGRASYDEMVAQSSFSDESVKWYFNVTKCTNYLYNLVK